MNDLEKYRQEIEAITKEMLDLLEKRLELSKEVARYKKEHQMPIFQPEREKRLVTVLCASRQYQEACESFLKELMDLSKALQKEEMEK